MTVVRLLVLGAIRMRGQAHGDAVHRELLSWKVETWTDKLIQRLEAGEYAMANDVSPRLAASG